MVVWQEFSRGIGGGWDVRLNTTMFAHIHLLQPYARAYHKAGRRLIECFGQAFQDDGFLNEDAHPIVSLYRHALELYLKTVIVKGGTLRWLRGGPKPIKQMLSSHDLEKLLTSLKEIFGLIDCSSIWSAPTFQSFVDIERVVQSVNRVPHDAFRYPIGHSVSKELLPDGIRFSLSIFSEKLDGLLDLLEAAANRI